MSEYHVIIHEPHNVHHTVLIGDRSVIWPFTTILEGTEIGTDCVIGATCFIGRHCRIGKHVVMHSGAQMPDNAIIGHYCMIGPNVVLTDCAYPNLRDRAQELHRPPVLEDDVCLGANSVILPGVRIGAGAQIGAGAIVVRDIQPGAVVSGNPARLHLRSAVILGQEG